MANLQPAAQSVGPPSPLTAATPIAFGAFIALFFLGFQLEKHFRLPPGIGNWLPFAAFALWATVTKYCRPLLARA